VYILTMDMLLNYIPSPIIVIIINYSIQRYAVVATAMNVLVP